MRIHFHGGIDSVTGSMHRLEVNGAFILRDCGLFQGHRQEERDRNRHFPFQPAEVRSLVLSHAHIDHCGNIPSLPRQGYYAPILTTTATVALGQLMLRDSARIQEQDAAYLNQKTSRKGLDPVEPLYTTADAERALSLFRGHRYGETVEAAPGVMVTFLDAGHILGAALNRFVLTENGRTRKLGYAFDLGRKNLPLIRDPQVLEDIDDLVIESTYGDRLHDQATRAEEDLGAAILRTLERHGRVLIPSFALERAQEVLYHLASLIGSGRLPELPVYVDSPLATAITDVFSQYPDYLDDEYRALRAKLGHVMHARWVKFVQSVEESKAITAGEQPCVVIAASGMCEFGRILHHLKHGIENPANTVLMVGFQAENTLGRRLADGEKRVRIYGDWLRVRAEVVTLNAFSAHADRNELLDYIRAVRPARAILVHGEAHQRAALAEAIRTARLCDVLLPSAGDVLDL